LYFGEMTIYPASGYGSASEVSDIVAEQWHKTIFKSWFLQTAHRWPMSIYAAALRRHFDRMTGREYSQLLPGAAA
ncbi:hypothetical protein KC219_24135, partial [Mycobacterium tuberculosis]|nr:hypothetical protein [Mycobacterium tuberculosis]